jgi:predicted GNAT family acetyltransferase
MASQSETAYQALTALAKPEEPMVLFLEQPAIPPQGWRLEVSAELTQMIYQGSTPPMASDTRIEPLSASDVSEMLELARLTRPGPFREKTIILGSYFGIREEGRLVAMAGERLHLEGYREVSAVCTHPSSQGKGYAKTLVNAVIHHILCCGEIPFLHTGKDNHQAIRVYEKLGFHHQRMLHVAVLRLEEAATAIKR